MAKVCAITKKTSKVAGGYSNRIRATKFNPTGMVRKQVNLQKKRIFVPELNKTVSITVSTQGLRTIAKKGAYKALKDAGII
ncbi:MAG TPA: bL28 family ribosomal protein [Candidatus Paceibacterota bacterium]|nr:bL28 family ribosomal protein [Candidatus Paceibacterota bacterium]